MKRVLLACLLVAACQSSNTDERQQQSEATRAVPAWVAPNFVVPPRSATIPAFVEPEVIYFLPPRTCSPASDSYGPSDCATGAARSVISTGKVWEEGDTWKLGQRFLYSFEFWIDPKLAYPGYRNPNANRTGGVSSRLSIARWEGADTPLNQLFDLKVDATRGVTFLGRTCVPPSEFGKWHRFNLRIKWTDDQTGFIEARCDGSLHTGLPIFAQSNIATNRALQCLRESNCDPSANHRPDRFNMELGIIVDGGGQSQIVPNGGLTVKMRRVIVRRLYVIMGRVEDL